MRAPRSEKPAQEGRAGPTRLLKPANAMADARDSGGVAVTASIKGLALQLAAAPIQRALDHGRLSWDELEATLHQQDLALLDDKIIATLWYPVATFDRIMSFTLSQEGINSDRQCVQVGYQVGNGLLTNHVYDEMVSAAARRQNRAGHTLIGLAPLLLNFSRWSFDNESEDGHQFRIEVTEASELPACLTLIVQGLVEYLTMRVFGTRFTVTSERLTPDHILFRTRP